mmetsp:Transcript_91927/g.154161  ORF Transcript_91927/g.154161 Transcript_91927/m.154161 type:complete len:90 (+) Transcript_91927:520-789(+)
MVRAPRTPTLLELPKGLQLDTSQHKRTMGQQHVCQVLAAPGYSTIRQQFGNGASAQAHYTGRIDRSGPLYPQQISEPESPLGAWHPESS